jgi:hypothetical protein
VAQKKSVGEILGARPNPASILFILFIPSKTADGKNLPGEEDQKEWADAAGDLLSKLFGGATEMPVGRGKWLNRKTKEIITEPIILVHSYATPTDVQDEKKMHQLAVFLHRMGKRTRQGEVAVVINGVFHPIESFPLAD